MGKVVADSSVSGARIPPTSGSGTVALNDGKSTDLWLLRRFATDPALGTSAIAAVRMIEERMAST